MPSNISIAKMGSQRFLDMTADMHNGHGYAWLIEQLTRLDRSEVTKRDICKSMNITGPTFDKYRFVINLERAQKDGNK